MFGPPADPFDTAEATPHNGTDELRRARDLVAAGDHAAAIGHCEAGRAKGVPAELEPHAHVIHGIALLHEGRPDEAVTILRDGWSSYPDFAAIPALLGVALWRSDRADQAARPLFAAVLGEDPDGSLPRYRLLLSRFV